MKYFIIVLFMSLFVIGYVWQNIEVMKIKMQYRKQLQKEKNIIIQHDKITYEIEKLKSFERMEKIAAKKGYRRIKPKDFIIINYNKQ